MKNVLKKIRNFIFLDWKNNHNEIKYWKILFYLLIFIVFSYSISFNSYIIKVTDVYVKMDEYFVNGYDFNSNKNKLFKIEESWTFGIFDAATLYGNITKEKYYYVNTFGIRISIPPIFSTFPNIISVEEIKVN